MMTFLKALFPIEILRGLLLTGRHFLEVFLTANRRRKPRHVVEEYPEVPVVVAPRFRGRLQLLRDDMGEIKCVCCMACVKACPTGVITIEAGKKEGRKTRIPLRYDFDLERCVFCGFCVESCGFDAILLNQQFELAVYDRKDLPLTMEGEARNLFRPSPTVHFSVADDGREA